MRGGRVLIYSMSVSVDGYIADPDGDINWTAPDDELFGSHLDEVRNLDSYLCGRKLYETMRVWETDPSLRDGELTAAFADVWCALPKVVFSRTLDRVDGNARLATGTLAEEIAATTAADKTVEIAGAALAASAVEQGLVDDFRMFRCPVVLGGGTPFLPAVPRRLALRLIETRTFSTSGVVYERYGRA